MDVLNTIIVEDDETTIGLYKAFFKNLQFPNCALTIVKTYEDFINSYKEKYYNLALIDHFLPDGNSRQILPIIKKYYTNCHITLVSSISDVETLSELYTLGLNSFLSKPIKENKLKKVVMDAYDKVINHYKRLFDNTKDSNPKPTKAKPIIENIIYKSSYIENVLNKVIKVAPSIANILIRGESGTGKELIAKAVQSLSNRKNRPFIELNIAALPETLIESELFGHKKGAFTGADKDRIGRFEECDGGTIFIDEIGDIPLQTQVKLLRVLQFKTFQRVGENINRTTDVRVIAATSCNLEEMISKKEYREDLFYRLSVISLKLSPLRERTEDILPLTEHFISEKAQLYNKAPLKMTENFGQALLHHKYPGNIRELENIIEHAVILCEGNTLSSRDLPEYMRKTVINKNNPELQPDIATNKKLNYTEQLIALETHIIKEALKESKGNQRKAARILEISERKLRYRLQLLGIKNEFRSEEE